MDEFEDGGEVIGGHWYTVDEVLAYGRPVREEQDMDNRCCFCDTGGVLVKITCARSDTAEVLDSVCLCPECFRGSRDLTELFSLGVVRQDPDSGTESVGGHNPE